MNNTIKLGVIHSNYVELPIEAQPYNEGFDPSAPSIYVERNIEKTLAFLHEAGRNKVDLVCTNEDFMGSNAYMLYLDRPELFSSLVEEIPGPTSYRLGEIAKLYHMHIAANYFEKDGNEIFNTTVLIDRTGEVTGKYRKVHLPPSEKWRVTGGKEFSVFETDIGRIGFAICYDIVFPEHCRAVALNGADIIIHQTQGWTGDALIQVRSSENSVYMAVAKNIQSVHGEKSCVVDNSGKILAEAAWAVEKVITAEFTPDFDKIREDHYNSLYSGVSCLKARMVLEREPFLYSVFIEKKPPVLDRYKGMELHTTPDKAAEVFRQWREYEEAVKSNKPVKIKYHW